MCEELAATPLGSIAAVDEFSSVASERHRSMLRCLEWSLGHLAKSAPNDAAGFQRLGVFAGRFTEDAVGRVCKVEDPRQLLTHLIKTSLVHACPGTDPRRYTLLNFTRAFARDKAKADGLYKELSERHVSFYLSLIQPTEEDGVLVVDTPASWEQDWPDLLAAAHAAPNIGQLQAVWRISRALGPFLHVRGLWSERERLNRAAVDAASRAPVRSALERALIDLGIILEAQGRWPEAVHQYKLSLVSANRHQTPRPTHQAMALQRLGGVLTRMGDTAAAERARKKLEEVNHLLEQPRAKARSLDEVGKTFQAHGDLGNAEAKYREAFQIRESIGDTVGLARSKENLGIVLSLQGNWPLAEKELQECFAYWASQDDSRQRGILQHHLADLCRRQGRFPEALDHCTQSLQCRKDDPKGRAVTLVLIAKIHRIQGHFDDAVAALEQSKNLCRSIGDVEGESIALDQLGGIYSWQQKWPDALAVFEGSRRLKDSAQRRDVVGLGITLDRIAQLHARCNNWTQALAAGIESLGYLKEAGRKVPAAVTMMNVAMMHAAQGQKAPALHTLDDAITSLQSEDSGKAVLQEARKLRARLGRKMRDGTPWVHWQDAAFKNQQFFIRKQCDREREAKRWQEAAASYKALAGEYTDSGRQMEAGLALNELGSVYRHLGDFARSEETIRHALTLFEDIALPLGLAVSWHKLGDLFAEQCLWSKAEQAYNKSIKLKRECFDDEGEAISQDALFDVLVKLGRLEAAQRAANRAWEIMSEIGSDLQKWYPLVRLLWLKATQRDAAGVQDIADRIATAFRGSRYRESTVRALQMAAAGNDWENLQALWARAGITGPTELPAPSGQGVSKLLPRISKLIQGCSSLSVARGAAFVRRVLAGAWRRH
jgi:tetratricopeptide (TPR) repeat protein